MKILLLFPMADGQTGPAIKYAFETLGHTVSAVDAKLDWRHSYAASIDFRPDLIFCSRTAGLAESMKAIKEDLKDAVACVWNVDTRYDIHEWNHLFPLIRACNYYFVVAYKLIPQWRKINRNTFWLPQGLQNEVYNKPKEITEEDRKTFECDISFAGRCNGCHKWRVPYLDAIEKIGVKFRVWGCEGHSQVYNEEHNKMISLSKINLCCSGWPKNEKYTSVRNYKVMGAGGFVLELYRKGINDIFPSNTMSDYEDSVHLLDQIAYWLNHEKERKEIAERGYKWVYANATYTHRMKTALEHMGL